MEKEKVEQLRTKTYVLSNKGLQLIGRMRRIVKMSRVTTMMDPKRKIIVQHPRKPNER